MILTLTPSGNRFNVRRGRPQVLINIKQGAKAVAGTAAALFSCRRLQQILTGL
jgi:hypothetical protein